MRYFTTVCCFVLFWWGLGGRQPRALKTRHVFLFYLIGRLQPGVVQIVCWLVGCIIYFAWKYLVCFLTEKHATQKPGKPLSWFSLLFRLQKEEFFVFLVPRFDAVLIPTAVL